MTRQTIPSFDRRNDKGLALMTKAIAEVTPEEPRLPSGRSRDPRNDVPAAGLAQGGRHDQNRGGGEGRGGGQPRRDGAKPAAQGAKASAGGRGGDLFRGPKREGAAKAWSPID